MTKPLDIMKPLVACASALVLVAVIAVPGSASATFGGAMDLSAAGQNAFDPQVAIGADGATTITWRRSNGTHTIVQAATRPAGAATFGAAESLSAVGRDGVSPRVATGADGATTVVWYRADPLDGNRTIIQAATRPAGSATFGATVDLSAVGQDAFDPQVAVGADGATTVTWLRYNGSHYIIQAATRPADSATFGAVVDLSVAGQSAFDPQVAVGADGATTVVWRRSNGSNSIVQAATRPAGAATFGAAVDLSAVGQGGIDPQVAVGADGATTVTWNRFNGFNPIIQAATRPAGSAAFGAAVNLSAVGRDALESRVAVGADGATTVVWRRSNGINNIIQAATRPAGSATFGAAVDLSAVGQDAEAPQVAIGANGATTITWRRFDGSRFIIQAATRSAESPAPAPVDPPIDPPVAPPVAAPIVAPPPVTLRVTRIRVSPRSINSRVTVSPRGAVRQVGTVLMPSTSTTKKARRITVCTMRKTVRQAGVMAATCRLSAKTRAVRKRQSLKVRLVTTFTPVSGVARSVTKVVVLKRTR